MAKKKDIDLTVVDPTTGEEVLGSSAVTNIWNIWNTGMAGL